MPLNKKRDNTEERKKERKKVRNRPFIDFNVFSCLCIRTLFCFLYCNTNKAIFYLIVIKFDPFIFNILQDLYERTCVQLGAASIHVWYLTK